MPNSSALSGALGRRHRKLVGQGHDDLPHYIRANPDLLAFLLSYTPIYAYESGERTSLWLGFGRFDLEEIAHVFADPLGRRALTELLNAYRKLGFALKVNPRRDGGWHYEILSERGALTLQEHAETEIGAWAAAAFYVNGRVIDEYVNP